MDLKLKKKEESGILLIKPVGRIDPITVEVFDKAIEDAIKSGKYNIIIDCSELSYISSAGLGVLIGYIEEVREKGGDIVICCTSSEVYEIFDLLGFTKIYKFFPDTEKARNFFRSG